MAKVMGGTPKAKDKAEGAPSASANDSAPKRLKLEDVFPKAGMPIGLVPAHLWVS
jgi:hypothetical protein